MTSTQPWLDPLGRRVYVLVLTTLDIQCDWPPGDIPMVFVAKSRPDSQKGRLNLPGGKVHVGETLLDAARRELIEETSLIPIKMTQRGTLTGPDFVIAFFTTQVSTQEIRVGKGEDPAHWMFWKDAYTDPRLLPSLRTAIPLALTCPGAWVLHYTQPEDVEEDPIVTHAAAAKATHVQ